MNEIDLKGQVAIVTGGAQGIGLAVAQRLRASGARLALWDLDQACLQQAVEALGADALALPVPMDITQLDSVEAAARQTRQVLGDPHILVHSAGIAGANGPLVDYPVDEWRRVMEVNVQGAFHVNRVVLQRMLAAGYGRIVNIASVAGKEGNPNAAAYSASKAALIAMTKSLGKETAGHDIAVNAITPAAARTRIFEQMLPQHIEYMLSKIPRGRFVEPDEIAAMVAWLASRENSFTTGAVFDLSGGRATY